MDEFYTHNENVSIRKRSKRPGQDQITRAIRVYSTFRDLQWALQIFGPLMIGAGYTEGKDDIVATVQLNRAQVTALRDHLTAILEKKEE